MKRTKIILTSYGRPFPGINEFICVQLISQYSHLIMSKGSDNCYMSICLRQVAKGHKLLPGCYVNSINAEISTARVFISKSMHLSLFNIGGRTRTEIVFFNSSLMVTKFLIPEITSKYVVSLKLRTGADLILKARTALKYNIIVNF